MAPWSVLRGLSVWVGSRQEAVPCDRQERCTGRMAEREAQGRWPSTVSISTGGVPASTPPPPTWPASLLPRGVLVDVLRDVAGQLTPTGATLPPRGSILALLCHDIEHEALGIGMIVKGLKLGTSLNLHHARIPYALMASGADELFRLHGSHHLSISFYQHACHQNAPFS